jgi:excinuclease ABC subunit C
MEKLEKIISKIPLKSGVYLFKNSDEKIIYVGKAVNLKSRVSSYFNDGTILNAAKTNMV